MNYWAWSEQIRRLIDSYLTNNYYYITCLNETCKSQFKRGFYSILGFKFKRVFSLLRSLIENSSFENFKINMRNMATSQILENFQIFFEKII